MEQKQQPDRNNDIVEIASQHTMDLVSLVLAIELGVFFGFRCYFASETYMEEKLRLRNFLADLCFFCTVLVHMLCHYVLELHHNSNSKPNDQESLSEKYRGLVSGIAWTCFLIERLLIYFTFHNFLYLANTGRNLKIIAAAVAGFCAACNLVYLSFLCLQILILVSNADTKNEKDEEDEWINEEEWDVVSIEEEGENENEEEVHQRCALQLMKVKKERGEWIKMYENLAAELVEARASVEVCRLHHNA